MRLLSLQLTSDTKSEWSRATDGYLEDCFGQQVNSKRAASPRSCGTPVSSLRNTLYPAAISLYVLQGKAELRCGSALV